MSGVLMKLIGVGAPRYSKRRGSLIIPSADPGSIGDDAMVLSIATSLHESGEGPVYVLARGRFEDWKPVPNAELMPVPPSRTRKLELIRTFRRMKRVYVIGADCLDGHYHLGNSIRLIKGAHTAACAGAKATIVGSSFKENAVPETVQAIRELDDRVRLCARDPRTKKRIEEMTGKTPLLVTDVAFMLKPTTPTGQDSQEVDAWIAERKAQGRVLLGVNFNRQVFGSKPTPDQYHGLMDAYDGAIRRLLDEQPNVDVVYIPHDYRGQDSDRDNAIALARRIDRPDRAIALIGTYRASEIKHFGAQMDLVLTGRMHLAVESLGAGTPVACVTYQDKFEGLFEHFRMEPIVLAPEDATADSMYSMVSDALSRRDALREKVRSEIDRIRALSRKNLGLDED